MSSPTLRDDSVSTCPYSLASLQCFLLIPLVKICQCLELPNLVGYFVALSLPYLLFHSMIKLLSSKGYVTLVKHSAGGPGNQQLRLSPSTNHPHSSETTIRVIIYSLVLGIFASVSLDFIIRKPSQHLVPLGFYLGLLVCFHFSEYFVTSLTNPSNLSTDSFLLNQSLAYKLAIMSSFLEYLVESYLFVGFKKFNLIAMLGLLLAVSGDLIRKIAMFTAGKNFSHLISSSRDPEHKLVTHGIYAWIRHPSYAGWFYWALGSQILMLNPLCFILFFVTSYTFFKDRIEYEESKLVEFFREDYEDYRRRVGTWLPIQLEQQK